MRRYSTKMPIIIEQKSSEEQYNALTRNHMALIHCATGKNNRPAQPSVFKACRKKQTVCPTR
jgi:hypothetical protein